MPRDYAAQPDGSVVLPVCPDCNSPLVWDGQGAERPNMREGALWWCPVCEEQCIVTGPNGA
jgi:uncharacterized protein YbaR (Trm112 family)